MLEDLETDDLYAFIVAFDQTEAHWERMIEWVKAQAFSYRFVPTDMLEQIGESWFANSCALCKKAQGCEEDCPLGLIYGRCSLYNQENKWRAVALARSWGEWGPLTELFIGQIKAAHRQVITELKRRGVNLCEDQVDNKD